MPYNSNIISFMDNIVIQYNTGVMIYNLTKQKELIINYEKDDPLLQLNDVYIDQKSRIYVSNSISIMFVSLKKKSFDTLYECDTSLIKSFMTISDNFIVFSTKFNDIYILARKSKESFNECKIVSGDLIPSVLKMVLPQFDLNIYDYSSREDMILKKREAKQLRIPYKVISYIALSDLYVIFSVYNAENEIYVIMYNTKL